MGLVSSSQDGSIPMHAERGAPHGHQRAQATRAFDPVDQPGDRLFAQHDSTCGARPNTRLSKPLIEAWQNNQIVLRIIPGT